MRFPRVVAFDLDGTLVDSRGDIAAACNHVLERMGRPRRPEADIAALVGDGARTLLARLLDIPRDSKDLDPAVAEWASFYAAHPIERTTWMPGAQRALDELPARGVHIALVTNKARRVTEAILDALGVRGRFEAVFAGGDGPLKPAPDAVLRVAADLRSPPADVCVVGDGTQDIGSAHAAGALAVAILGGFHSEDRLRAARPDRIYPTLDAFLDDLARGPG